MQMAENYDEHLLSYLSFVCTATCIYIYNNLIAVSCSTSHLQFQLTVRNLLTVLIKFISVAWVPMGRPARVKHIFYNCSILHCVFVDVVKYEIGRSLSFTLAKMAKTKFFAINFFAIFAIIIIVKMVKTFLPFSPFRASLF